MPRPQKARSEAQDDPIPALRRMHDRVAQLHVETVESLLPANLERTISGWLAHHTHRDDADMSKAVQDAMILAADLETFVPSHSGAIAIDRLSRRRKIHRDEEPAVRALKEAKFTAFALNAKTGDDVFGADDLATRQSFNLLSEEFPPEAIGVAMVARLCDLGGGIRGVVGIPTPLDAAGLAVALDFAKPGRGIVNGHRAAAAVYRHVVRHGNPAIIGVNVLLDPEPGDDEEAVYEPTSLDRMVADLGIPGPEGGQPRLREPTPDMVAEARRIASVDTVLELLFKAATSVKLGVPQVGAAFRRLAEVQIEALHLRALAGTGHDRSPLDTIARAIDREIATEDYSHEAADLFREIRRVVTAVKRDSDQEDLTRVIERIRGLRSKTIDQGCTEEEALAAADKVAEMLDRYGLTLGEIDLRGQACQGYGIESNRKRTGPLDQCLPAVARFCDCRAWHERSPAGTVRSVLFGLPADVEAARYLYERVATAFETETARFKASSLYTDRVSADRRGATTSFQIGLAQGITERLTKRKAERDATTFKATGRDLVPVKASVVEDELAKLGLSFESGGGPRSRLLQVQAFEAGQIAGLQFEAQSELE